MRFLQAAATSLLVSLAGCAESTPAPVAPVAPARHEQSTNLIVSLKAQGTARELRQRGEQALLGQRWQEAVDVFEALWGADPGNKDGPSWLSALGMAYEGLGDREKARERYRTLVQRFPDDGGVRGALVREASIDAYLEDWKALGAVGEAILARKDGDDVERMLGLGARSISRVQAGDVVGALRDANAGLDLMESRHYGATGRLPVPAAQLRFALAEIRRVRSEAMALQPVTPDFLVKIEARCQGLLDAQNAYADAIRSVDPTWAKMSGYRVGEMYRVLHRDLMAIPPYKAKNESDRQLFYAMMHLRYRVLLEKGLDMMTRTMDFAEKTNDASSWVTRAREARADMERSLEDEKAQMAKFPFTEEEVKKALDMLQKRAEARAQGKSLPEAPRAAPPRGTSSPH